MTYKLFIDDIRNPTDPMTLVVRNSAEACNALDILGMPIHIDFDHDLGEEDNSIKFINYLIDCLIDRKVTLPYGFTYSVHSMNPVGRTNIEAKMNNIINHFK